MRNPNFGAHSVARILMISPLQNELLRRNKSRIFIAPTGEGVIDSVLFGGYRPIENFIDIATAAIAMAGLHDAAGDILLKPAFEHGANSIFQQHLLSTGWLQNDQSEVVDLIIEVNMAAEDLPDINMKSFNGDQVEGYDDNPLCIFCDIQDLYPQGVGNVDQYQGEDEVVQKTATQTETENNDSGSGGPNGQGRVTDPSTDRRLKSNREMARRPQDRDNDGSVHMGRMAGKPGRVRDPLFDMRLKSNRIAISADAGGR